MSTLIMILRGFEYNNITETKLGGLIVKYRKCTINTRMNKINSDSSEQKYVHLSNSLIQSDEICHMFTV